MQQITDNSQHPTPINNLLPQLYQHLNKQLLELTIQNRQLQADIRDNGDQYYEELIQCEKQLYGRLEDRDKLHKMLQSQLEEWLCRYNKLENMEEMYDNQVEDSVHARLRKQDQLKQDNIRNMAQRNRQQQRQPEYQAELQRYRQNNIKYKYLEQKNKQLQTQLLKQKQQLQQLINIQQQQQQQDNIKNNHKHNHKHNNSSTNTVAITNTNTNRSNNRTTKCNKQSRQVSAQQYVQLAPIGKQQRYTISTISQSRDLCGNVVRQEQLASINQFNI